MYIHFGSEDSGYFLVLSKIVRKAYGHAVPGWPMSIYSMRRRERDAP